MQTNLYLQHVKFNKNSNLKILFWNGIFVPSPDMFSWLDEVLTFNYVSAEDDKVAVEDAYAIFA